MSAPSQIRQLSAYPEICKNQQLLQQNILQETVRQQEILIKILKQQIQKVQNQLIIKQKILLDKQRLYNQALLLIDSQKQKIKELRENNQSIIHTFQVFQRQFVKRDYKHAINLPQQRGSSLNTDGHFFLQLIRNMKSKFSQASVLQPQKKQQKSELNQYYGYFLNQQLDSKQVALFDEVRQRKFSNLSIKQKVRSFGRKNYFNQMHRQLFWYHAIDKGLRITRQFYEDLVLKSQRMKQSQKDGKVSLIDRDLHRMDLKLQDEKQKIMKSHIKKSLQAFQVYRPDVGYIQGMSYLAWMFLVRMDGYKAFCCFSNLILCDSFIYNLYFFKETGIKKIKQFYDSCMEQKRNKIFKHMKSLEVQCQFFIIQWAYTMFTRAFSLRISSKIWDLWLSEGFNVFFRVVLVIMDMLESELLETTQNQKFIEILRTQTHKLDEVQFLRNLRRQRLSQQLQF